MRSILTRFNIGPRRYEHPVRALQPHHPQYAVVDQAVQLRPSQGRPLHVFPQNLIELWTVITRPLTQNAFGMNTKTAATEIERVKSMFLFLPDSAAIYPAWETLVTKHQVTGKTTHDARLVAAMQVHGLSAILSFDKSGFSRYPASRS